MIVPRDIYEMIASGWNDYGSAGLDKSVDIPTLFP